MSELLVNTIKKADGTGSLTVPAESGTVVVKDGSNDVTLNDITATGVYLGGTGAANYLDDYEEGTWTPVLGGDTSTSGQSYSRQDGHYTKIGNYVFANFELALSNKGTISGNLRILGLPFNADTPSTAQSGSILFGKISAFSSISDQFFGFTLQDTTKVALRYGGFSGVNIDATTSNVNNTSQLIGTVIYQTDA